jgi:hypothetical protein
MCQVSISGIRTVRGRLEVDCFLRLPLGLHNFRKMRCARPIISFCWQLPADIVPLSLRFQCKKGHAMGGALWPTLCE